MRRKDTSFRVFRRILGYQMGDLVRLRHSMSFSFYPRRGRVKEMSFQEGKEGTIVLIYESCIFKETVFLVSFGMRGMKHQSTFKLGTQDFE